MRSENSAAVREAAKENGIVKDEPFHIKMCGLTYANCGKN